MKVILNNEQQMLMRKVLDLQLESLDELSESDILLMCLQEDLPEDELRDWLELRKERFMQAKDNPNEFLLILNDDDLDIVKHIIVNFYMDYRPCPREAIQIWSKLCTYDNFTELCHLN